MTAPTGPTEPTEPTPPVPAPSPPAAPAPDTGWPQWAVIATIGFIVIVLVAAWQQLLGGGILVGGQPSPTAAVASGGPEASATPSSSAAAGASPSAGASAKPAASATPKPTAAATSKPTTAPTAAPTSVPAAFCAMPSGMVTVAYPADWYTLEQPPFACVPYDQAPITITSDQSLPNAPVAAVVDEVAYNDALTDLTDPNEWQIQSQKDTRVSGKKAVVIEAAWIGKAPYVAGTMRYFYLVDNGSSGSVLFITQGMAGNAYDEQKDVVNLMAAQSTIK